MNEEAIPGNCAAFRKRFRRPFAVCIGLIALILCACRTGSPDKSQELFSGYLEKEFNLSIPEGKHFYILVPRLICRGCVEQKFDELHALAGEENRTYFTVITSNPQAVPEKILRKLTVLYDHSGLLDRLNLSIANMAVARTENGRLQHLVSIPTIHPPALSEIVDF